VLTLEEMRELLSGPKGELLSSLKDGNSENPFNLPPPFEFQERAGLFADYLESMESFLEGKIRKNLEELRSEKEKSDKIILEQLNRLKEDVKAGRIPLSDPQDPDYHYYKQLIYAGEQGNLEALAYLSNRVNNFANIFRKSFFSNLYGFFESQLEQLCHSLEKLCHTVENHIGMPHWSADKQRGSILEAAKPFLKEIGFPTSNGLWQEIIQYRRLRNCIVHAEGKLSGAKEERELRQYIDRSKTLSLNDDEIILSKSFCEEALLTIRREFFRERLLIALAQWWGRIN